MAGIGLGDRMRARGGCMVETRLLASHRIEVRRFNRSFPHW